MERKLGNYMSGLNRMTLTLFCILSLHFLDEDPFKRMNAIHVIHTCINEIESFELLLKLFIADLA